MFKRFSTGFLLPFLLVGSTMYLFDPFHLFHFINTSDRPHSPRERVSVAHKIVDMRPSAAFFGTSRTRRLDPSHPGWGNQVVLNGAIGGAKMYEIAHYFEHAQAVRPLQTALIELAIRNNFPEMQPSGGPVHERLLLAENRDFSSQVRMRIRRIIDIYEGLFSLKGMHLSPYFNILTENNPLPEKTVQLYTDFPPAPEKKNPNPSRHTYTQIPTMDSIRRIVRLAEANNTDVRFFLATANAKLLHGVITLNDWEWYEKELKEITEYLDGGNEFGKRYTFWTFQRYNDITLMQAREMQPFPSEWYDDPAHFGAKVGTLILDTVFGTCNEPCITPPADFGVLLTRDTLDAHLAHLRLHRQQLQADGRKK